MENLNKSRIVRALRIIMPIVAILIVIVVAPLDLIPAWIAPLSAMSFAWPGGKPGQRLNSFSTTTGGVSTPASRISSCSLRTTSRSV